MALRKRAEGLGTVEHELEEEAGGAGGFGTGRACDGEHARDLEAADAGDLQGAELELIADGPARDEGNAQARFDSVEKTFGGIEGEAEAQDAEGGTGCLESLFEDAARAGAVFTEQQVGLGEIGEAEAGFGPLVSGRNDENEAVLKKWRKGDVVGEGGTFDQGELDTVVAKQIKDVLGVAALDFEADAGLGGPERGQEAREHVLADGLRSAEAKVAGGRSGGGRNGFRGLLCERCELAGEGQERLPGRCEGYAACGTCEERRFELGFESFDLLRDGRLGEEQFFRGSAEVQGARNGAEDA